MKQPKSVKAWAVVTKGGRILAEKTFETQSDAIYWQDYWGEAKVIPVLITPIIKKERKP